MLWSFIRNITRAAASPSDHAASDDRPARGMESFNSGDFAAASRLLSESHAADPGDADVLYYFALAEARGGRLEQAEALFEMLRPQRDDADVNNALANVRRLRGRLDDAVAGYRHALEIDSRHLAALANLGLALRDQGLPQQALPVLDRALALAPDHVEALFNKALALVDLDAGRSAEELIEQVLQLDPDFAQAHLQRGFMLLKRRDFAAGWREYAWRVRIPDLDHWQDYAYPLWQGEALTEKRVLVQAEQGLGDQIMFASCLPDLLARARHTVFECDPRLAKLFARSFAHAVVYRHRVQGVPDWSSEPAPDYRVRLGDLPRVLRNQDDDFPRHDGYLVADPVQAADWSTRLAALGPGLKIGISWRGGTPGTGQAARSLPLEALVPILSLPRAHFISLQYGAVSAEVAELRARHGVALHAWSQSHADMDGVAALISSLDLVITVCTTVAHLAGGLGKSAWVMVPAVAEWRYLETGVRMPWYPALRLFRQPRLNEWASVISTIRTELISELNPRIQ
jgi:tetratricopeptide (TPR) repeat protein